MEIECTIYYAKHELKVYKMMGFCARVAVMYLVVLVAFGEDILPGQMYTIRKKAAVTGNL